MFHLRLTGEIFGLVGNLEAEKYRSAGNDANTPPLRSLVKEKYLLIMKISWPLQI